MAHITDVVDAATRLVADQGIIGRALIIGSPTSATNSKTMGLDPSQSGKDQAVWDVYAHDYEQSDLFTRRVVGITNLVAQAKGWAGFLADIRKKLLRF